MVANIPTNPTQDVRPWDTNAKSAKTTTILKLVAPVLKATVETNHDHEHALDLDLDQDPDIEAAISDDPGLPPHTKIVGEDEIGRKQNQKIATSPSKDRLKFR